jgi:Pectate lyase superfamily protein/Right handed beta helix region
MDKDLFFIRDEIYENRPSAEKKLIKDVEELKTNGIPDNQARQGVADLTETVGEQSSKIDVLSRKQKNAYIDIVEDFGADSTGVSDSTVKIQNALEYAKNNKIPAIYAPAGTYKITDSLTIHSNLLFYGAGSNTVFDGSSLPTGTALGQIKLFKVEGSLSSTTTTVTASLSALGENIAVSNSVGFNPDDLVIITNDEPYTAGTAQPGWKKGELQIINSVDTSSLNIKDTFLFSYDSTQNLLVRKINAIENVTLRDFNIKLGGVGKAHNAISCNYTKNIIVSNLNIDGAEDTGVMLFNSYRPTVINNEISNSTSPSTIGNTGYGISVMDACKGVLLERNTFRNCRHGVAGGGTRPSVLVNVFNNKAFGNKLAYPFDCHEPCFYWTFKENLADGCYGGVVARGQYITVENNDIINSIGSAIKVESYTAVTNQFGIVVKNNRIKNSNGFGIDVNGYQGKIRESIIEGNVIDNVKTKGINLYNFAGVEISNNTVLNVASGWGIYAGGLSNNKGYDLTLNNNRGSYTRDAIVYLEYIDRVDINGGKYNQSSNKEALYANGCSDIQVNGGVYRNVNTYCIRIIGGTKHQISDVRCSGATGVDADGIRIENATDININGGLVDGNTRHGINITGSDYVIVRGVNARNNTNTTKINVDATAVNKVVDGNII